MVNWFWHTHIVILIQLVLFFDSFEHFQVGRFDTFMVYGLLRSRLLFLAQLIDYLLFFSEQ